MNEISDYNIHHENSETWHNNIHIYSMNISVSK